MVGTSGNLSISIEKNPLQFLITASGKDKGELQEDDFILVDCRGVACNAPTVQKPSAETLLHSAIYKHTNANAVFHVHTVNSTLLSGLDKSSPYNLGSSPYNLGSSPYNLEFHGLEMLKGLGFKTHDVKINIPVVENSQDMEYLSGILPSYINEEIPGLLLKGHGIYAWGNSTEEAKRHVEVLEFLFEYRIKELSML